MSQDFEGSSLKMFQNRGKFAEFTPIFLLAYKSIKYATNVGYKH